MSSVIIVCTNKTLGQKSLKPESVSSPPCGYGNGEPKSPSIIRVRGVVSLLVPVTPAVVKLKAGPVQPKNGVDWLKDTGIVGEGIVPYIGTENKPDTGGGIPDDGAENKLRL